LFSDISVSQGSVAAFKTCGGGFNNRFTANLLQNLPVKKFNKLVKIWQNYTAMSLGFLFLALSSLQHVSVFMNIDF